MKRFITIFLLLFSITTAYGQDTIKVEPSVYYNMDSSAFYRYGYIQHAREDVIYSDSLRSIQYCFYMDSVRHCIGSVYQLKSNNIIQVSNNRDTIQWNYKKRNDSLYEVNAFVDGFYQYGLARSIQPLIFFNKQVTTTSDKMDTLWSAQYMYSPYEPEGGPMYTLYKKNISGKVYESKQCDVLPKLQNGTDFTSLTWENNEVCYNDPYYVVNRTVFIVTAEGRIINISEMGNLDWSCSPVYISFLKEVYRNSPLQPAMRKGKPVYIKWEVSVDMKQ